MTPGGIFQQASKCDDAWPTKLPGLAKFLTIQPHTYATRYKVHQYGMAEFGKEIEDVFWSPTTEVSLDVPITMSVMAADIANLGKCLGAMFVRLEQFDGTQNIKDFFQDFDRYLTQTATTSKVDELNTLIAHTTGEALAFYRIISPTPSFADMKSALQERFGLNIREKWQIKSPFYSSKQIPSKSFKLYVSRIQQMACQIDVSEAEVIEVCISGVRSELRPHLAMANVTTVKDLLKLAVVANESLVADTNP